MIRSGEWIENYFGDFGEGKTFDLLDKRKYKGLRIVYSSYDERVGVEEIERFRPLMDPTAILDLKTKDHGCDGQSNCYKKAQEFLYSNHSSDEQ